MEVEGCIPTQRKGLYNLTMVTEIEPTSALEKTRWMKWKDEAT